MSALLPVELLPIAGLLALILLWPRVRTQPATGRLVAEAFGMALMSIAIVWTAWVVLFLVEQH